MPADEGEALVAGADVRREPALVRRRIGYVGQLGGADVNATGRENLMLAGRLYGLSATSASRRCEELLAVFGLGDGGLADRAVRTYSGGQRRRLEVALGIMHRPGVLFLASELGMTFALQTELFFHRKLLETLRQPVWLVTGSPRRCCTWRCSRRCSARWRAAPPSRPATSSACSCQGSWC